MDGVFNIDGSLKYDVITGQVVDVVDKKLTVRRHLGGSRFLSCGVFLIKKSVWQKVSGMRTKYKAGEDPDLGLRLSKKGASFHFKNEPIVKHYTIHYHDRRRVWKRLGDKSSFYYRCVLYRDHVLNSNMYRLLYSYDKTFLLFITTIGFSFVFPSYLSVFASAYLLAILARSIKQQKILSLPEFIIYYALFDIINTWYLLFFYPRSSTVSYTKI
jgi:GT2 family glycosyltransferase